MMRLRIPIACIALSLAAGCFGDEFIGSSTVNGTYTLRTVNGAALPFTMPATAGTTTEVLDDAFTLYEGGTYMQSGHVRVTSNGTTTTMTVSHPGAYLLGGNTSVILLPADGGRRIDALSDAVSLTIVQQGVTSVYRK